MLGRRSTVGLLSIVVAFLVTVHLQWSPAGFGLYHDDSLYLSSARALATGEGYVIPSIPGEPAQTKYPIFYPWLLSLLWRLWPTFPDNLYGAFWLSALAAAAFLLGSFALLRQLGAGEKTALALTAVVAFHPKTLALGGALLSDIVFMALATWSLVLAGGALANGSTGGGAYSKQWLSATAFVSAAVMTRSLGIAVGAGIAAAAMGRRSFRAMVVVILVCVATFSAGFLGSWSRYGGFDLGFEEASGYEQTVLFYTSYLGFWKLCVPDWPTFGAMVSFNLGELLTQPAALCFLLPVYAFSPMAFRLVSISVSFVILKGVVTQARSHGWHPVHFAAAATVPIILLWNYTLVGRFLAPFLPVLLFGAWREIDWVTRTGVRVIRSSAPRLDRTVSAAMLASATALLVYFAGQLLWWQPARMSQQRSDREILAAAKQEAYRWVRNRTEPEDRLIAYEDVSLFLYTGRQGLRPIAFSTAAFYRQSKEIIDHDLRRFAETARELGARYWIVAADDFDWEPGEEMALDYRDDFIGAYPVVFESQDGEVRIHALGSLYSEFPLARQTERAIPRPRSKPDGLGVQKRGAGADSSTPGQDQRAVGIEAAWPVGRRAAEEPAPVNVVLPARRAVASMYGIPGFK